MYGLKSVSAKVFLHGTYVPESANIHMYIHIRAFIVLAQQHLHSCHNRNSSLLFLQPQKGEQQLGRRQSVLIALGRSLFHTSVKKNYHESWDVCER